MILFYYCTLITLSIVQSHMMYLPKNNQSNIILKCAEHISKQVHDSYVLIAYTNVIDNIDCLLQGFNKNVWVLTNMTHNSSKMLVNRMVDMYVIIIDNIDEYSKVILLQNNTEYWNPRAKFLIIFQGRENIDTLFKISWQYYIINVVIILQEEQNINIFTYFPYTAESCSYVNKIRISTKCDNITLENLYPEKIPFNMKGCVVKFGPTVFVPFVIEPKITTDDPKIVGIETVIIKNFLETMNLHGVMSDLNAKGEWGWKEVNGSFTGPYKYLSYKTSEFVFGHMWANMAYLADFDMSTPYYSSNIFWYVPSALPTKQWKSTITIFTLNLWITVIVLFVLNSLISWIFGRCINDVQQLQDLGLCFLYSLYSLCTGSFLTANKLPSKILILNWTVFGLLLSLIYQSQLLTLLTKPSFEHQISNLQELIESTLEIIIPYDAIVPMNDYKSKVMSTMLQKAHALQYEDIMRRSTSDIDGKSAFLQVTCCAKYLQSKYYTNEDGSSKIFQLKDYPFLSMSSSIYTLKGWPLLERFNQIILWFRQSGFLAKWEKDLDTTVEDVTFGSEPVVLNLNHFISAYFLLLIGLFLSGIAFIGELLVYKYKMNNKQLKNT